MLNKDFVLIKEAMRQNHVDPNKANGLDGADVAYFIKNGNTSLYSGVLSLDNIIGYGYGMPSLFDEFQNPWDERSKLRVIEIDPQNGRALLEKI